MEAGDRGTDVVRNAVTWAFAWSSGFGVHCHEEESLRGGGPGFEAHGRRLGHLGEVGRRSAAVGEMGEDARCLAKTSVCQRVTVRQAH